MSSSGGPAIEALLHIDIRDLTFKRDLNGFHDAELELVAGGFLGSNTETRRVGQAYKIHMSDPVYSQGLTEGVTASMNLPVSTPGPYQVHAVVRDLNSGKIGSDRESFEFPDLKSGKLTMSGIFLGGEDPATAAPGENSATRVFRPGRTVTYIYTMFNIRPDADKRSRLDSRVRILREGEEIYASDVTSVTSEPLPDPTRQTRRGSIHLLPNAKPGNYRLELMVVDKLEAAAPRSVTQSIDFEVR
jgi:hypothetical protein